MLFLLLHSSVSPIIDKGTTGSKTVKVNRSAIWHIKVRGEPPPKFTWFKDGRKIEDAPTSGREVKGYGPVGST